MVSFEILWKGVERGSGSGLMFVIGFHLLDSKRNHRDMVRLGRREMKVKGMKAMGAA